MAKVFGHIDGHPVGSHFPRRTELSEAGVHAPRMAGIHGNPREGADSIVVSGGYVDDEDHGNVIIYTGHGGRDSTTGRQTRDQVLTDSGNAGLVRSQLEGLLVRVIRGASGDPAYSPPAGFRYDGLFRVESHSIKMGVDGFRICQFRMVAAEEAEVAEDVVPFHGDLPHQPARTRTFTVQRSVRNSVVIQQVKQWHGGQCQLCALTLEIPGGSTYSEGAHIQALGRPHRGPDVTENVLCLCPNCHVLFDNGARYLTDDLRVIDGLTHQELAALRTHPRHRIDVRFVRQHRGRWISG
ncbi:HNH endonuclease [Kitasatospora sp. NBC_00374]|uniref:YDG/SRA domain-containing protein n=1 Tax=Kitasatospora sp. NBC_00374 TaxID=2975964 RepID=UPI00324436E0